jgi:vacuolar-type H+-ATPase subunit H
MKSRIESILECDKNAQKIVRNAELEKQKIENSTAEEIKALRDAAYKDAESQLSILRERERENNAKKIEAVKSDYARKLKEFENLFNANCDKWSDDIVGSVLKQQ